MRRLLALLFLLPILVRAIDGSLRGHRLSVIAGATNTGTDRNWAGHPLAQKEFGRG